MRLKEIKPGIAIYCETVDELVELRKHGIKGTSKRDIDDYMAPPCYVMLYENHADWSCDDGYVKRNHWEIVKFSNLIIPPLSAAEVLETFGTICSEYYEAECEGCPMRKDDECVFDRLSNPNTAKEVVEICERWRADHEKKKPEIEWTWHVEVHDDKHLYTGSFETEGEARAVIEEKVKNNIGAYGRYERICRVKQQERV